MKKIIKTFIVMCVYVLGLSVLPVNAASKTTFTIDMTFPDGTVESYNYDSSSYDDVDSNITDKDSSDENVVIKLKNVVYKGKSINPTDICLFYHYQAPGAKLTRTFRTKTGKMELPLNFLKATSSTVGREEEWSVFAYIGISIDYVQAFEGISDSIAIVENTFKGSVDQYFPSNVVKLSDGYYRNTTKKNFLYTKNKKQLNEKTVTKTESHFDDYLLSGNTWKAQKFYFIDENVGDGLWFNLHYNNKNYCDYLTFKNPIWCNWVEWCKTEKCKLKEIKFYSKLKANPWTNGSKFKLFLKKVNVKKLTKQKKAMKVTWKKASTDVTGYQIQYSTKKSMKSAKIIKVKKASTVSKTIKGLKAKKKYYVRIRAYRTLSESASKGTYTYYSAWSAKKTVTTK